MMVAAVIGAVTPGCGGHSFVYGDAACESCATNMCAQELDACSADSACTCWEGCAGNLCVNGICPPSVVASCNAQCGAQPATTGTLETCAKSHCAGLCP